MLYRLGPHCRHFCIIRVSASLVGSFTMFWAGKSFTTFLLGTAIIFSVGLLYASEFLNRGKGDRAFFQTCVTDIVYFLLILPSALCIRIFWPIPSILSWHQAKFLSDLSCCHVKIRMQKMVLSFRSTITQSRTWMGLQAAKNCNYLSRMQPGRYAGNLKWAIPGEFPKLVSSCVNLCWRECHSSLSLKLV